MERATGAQPEQVRRPTCEHPQLDAAASARLGASTHAAVSATHQRDARRILLPADRYNTSVLPANTRH